MASVITFCFLYFLSSSVIFAQSTQPQIKDISKKLQLKKEQISNISDSISKMGKMIDFKKQELEIQNKKIESLQDELKLLQDSYAPIKTELETLEQRVQKNLKHVLIYNMDNNDETHDLYSKKLLIKSLKDDLKILSGKKKENEDYQERIKMEVESLKDFVSVRDQLTSTLKEMDQDLLVKKEAKIDKPVKKIVRTSVPNPRVEITELFTSLPEKPQAMSFMPPINHFTQLTHNNSGVYFQFQDVGPVRAPGNGEVVFCGELASYGNVVIMDHGGEIRTVVLGNFYPKIKKNDKLNMGDIIGYTVVDTEKKNTVLFEVRKKMVTQNSIHWLNKTQLKKKY